MDQVATEQREAKVPMAALSPLKRQVRVDRRRQFWVESCHWMGQCH